ncbi:MAG: ATP-dependent helicase [Campylobacterota bacterium]|nr:ATP-dependent helicase [Campylobacterota bacterium]
MNYSKEIIKRLSDRENVFLTGGAGVGKTTITRAIIEAYEQDAKKVAKLASTGMAATLIGGQTLHSFFDFGIAGSKTELEQNKKFEISKKVKKLILEMSLVVIDEISMVGDALFEMIELRLMQASYKGAILVVGDFLQLPPVVRGYGEVRFAFESVAWQRFNFHTIELTHIYRTDDIAFIELLSHIRVGNINKEIMYALEAFLTPLPQDVSNHTFLYGKNISASNHNKAQLNYLEGDLFVKEARIILHQKNVKDAEIERFFEDARIEKVLELKIGASVLFSRNSWNYYNGEKGIIVNIDATFIYVQKSSGVIIKLEQTAQSKSVWVEKNLNGKKEVQEENLFSIYQYPVKLSYAITIHKSQGMSIEDLIIQTDEIFAPSQFYVAISRAQNPKRLILIPPKKDWRSIVFVNKKALEFIKK